MKKKLGLFIMILTFLLIPNIVKAENISVSLSGTSSASQDDEVKITIELNSEYDVTAFETSLKYDNTILKLESISKDDSWTGNNTLQSSGNNSLKFSNKGVVGKTKIAVLKFKVISCSKNNSTISLEDIKVTTKQDNDDVVSTHEAVKKDITIKSDENKLKTLKVDDKLVNGFSSDIYNYTIEVDAVTETVSITSTLNNSKTSSYVDSFGNRDVSLNYGSNEVLIKVKSESGKIATYKLNIVRKDDRVANTDLKSIIINGGKNKIEFDKSVLSYTIKTYKLETIDITAEPDDSTSTVKIDAPSKLIIGENKVKITVTAETGDKKEYILLIINGEVETDTRLKNLSVKGINIDFNSDIYEYKIRYNRSFKKGLEIYKTSISSDTEIEIIGNSNLKEGSIVKIIVNANDGSGSSEYKIILEKDSRINIFLIIDLTIGIVLGILIFVQIMKRKKIKKEKLEKAQEEELEKTKEIVL